MRSYRKKPVVIQAVQYRGGEQPGELAADVVAGRVYYAEDGSMRIRTLEGELTASPGDFIIRGVKGELYPCKPDIFVATYDEVIPTPEPLPCAVEGTRGFAHLRFLVALAIGAILVLCAPLLARGDEPKFGGCLESHPETCFAPAVSVNLLSLRLKDGQVMTTFDPGLGYGVTFFSRRWYQTGVAATVSFPELAGEKRVTPAGTVSFAEYARLGVACPLWTAGGFRENARLLIGFGADFGARW